VGLLDRTLMLGKFAGIAVCTKDLGLVDRILMLGKFVAIAVCGTELVVRVLMLGKLLTVVKVPRVCGTLSGTCSWIVEYV